MAKKKLKSGFELDGIAPNILLKHVENTAPFLFQGELNSTGEQRAYLEKLRFYKKNLKALSNINLSEYFHICMAAHWSTAGTFVPTDVDNQIREGLWKNKAIKKHIEKMARITIDSWKWDFQQVTNRKSYNRKNNEVLSTHEGTWLSVAIGAYCALVKHKEATLAQEVADVILAEIEKEQSLLIQLREDRDHINFLRTAPLMAHNFGDLDRVMVQWNMNEEDPFCKKIFKLGLEISEFYDPILVYTGSVNKEFASKENHRHMSMRQPRCLRKSSQFLIPVGPFMDSWGEVLGSTELLTIEEKAEIVAAFFEGYKRQDEAFGYCRAFGALKRALPEGMSALTQYLPFDIIDEIKKSKFTEIADRPLEEFEGEYIKALEEFTCPKTGIKF
ncbi:hypothetical protein A9Q84_11435 [Halobacteriovorax marinus]|uniref:Uncharacterized protein n=1 Tax=Halobacteriovorax marinus TaxID=97084 RepID=A0A1Y5FBW9_9BACT|nr:hypothetical protein A9Q84_11435 [Halobacteriovorax marinus]